MYCLAFDVKMSCDTMIPLFAVEVKRVIRLSPCQPDHAFESSTTIKVIIMKILWPSSSLGKVRDPVTKELRNHFDGEFTPSTAGNAFCPIRSIGLTNAY